MMRKLIEKTVIIAFILIIMMIISGCSKQDLLVTNNTSALQHIKTIKLTNEAQGYGARPEIASNGKYIYIVYLGNITTQRSHKVRVYDLDFNLITEKVLAVSLPEYGGVTDIRMSKDDNYIYTFYEMSSKEKGAHLFGAKYRMDENFTKIAESNLPIVKGAYFFDAVDGDETLDDPSSIIVDERVFIMTKIVDKSGGVLNSKTLYKLRELSNDLSTIIDTRDIDLSNIMGGWSAVGSLFYANGKIHYVQGNLVSYSSGINSDFKVVKFDNNWEYDKNKDVFELTNTEDITESMPVGARFVDNRLFISYRRGEVTVVSQDDPTSSGKLWLSIYNNNFEIIDSIQVSAEGIEGEHACVEVIGDYVYVAYGGSISGSDVKRDNVYVGIFKF